MKRFDIRFIADFVSNKMVRTDFRNFFLRKNLFNSKYIIVTVKAIINNENYYLVQRALLNLKDRQEIKTLTKKVLESLARQNIVLGTNSILSINYVETDLSFYNNYKASFINFVKIFYSTISSFGIRFYSKTLRVAGLKLVNFFSKIKLILNKIFFVSILFRASATGGDLNIPNLNEEGVHIQDTEAAHRIQEFRTLAKLQRGVDEMVEANNNRSLEELIRGYHQSFTSVLDRQADQFIKSLQNSDSNTGQVLTEIDKFTEISNPVSSLKSAVGIFDFVKKNKSNFVNSNIHSEVARVSNIPEVLKTPIQSVVGDTRPLGSVGDVTLNQLVTNFWDNVSLMLDFFKSQPNLVNIGGAALKIITPLLIYKSVMGIFNRVLPMPNPALVSEANYRQARKERLFFMLVPGPMLTYALINMVNLPLSSLSTSERVIAEGSENLLSNFKETKNFSFVSILGLKGNKKFNWKWLVGFFVILLIVSVFNFYNIKIIDIIYETINSPVFGKYLILVFIITNVIFILRYIFILLLIYFISKNKITKSIFLPSFLNKTYDNLESISKSQNLNIMINFYYRLMFIYMFLFFFSLTYYFIMY